MNKKNINIKHNILEKFICRIYEKYNVPKKYASIISKGLVRADIRGIWSHGIVRVPIYCKRIEKKVANPRPKIKFKNILRNILHIDGDNSLGFVTSTLAMKKCVQLAKKNGVAIAGIYNSNHFGMAANYLEIATKNNCIAWMFTSSSPALPPHGAMAAHFGTAPFAFGAPTANKNKPFILDMACSAVARGKLKFAAKSGKKIPYGLALDKYGKPTNDGAKAFEGIMLPFGGMKGAGISWMMDIIAGIFTGGFHSGNVKNQFGNDFSGPANVGHFIICLKADLFQNKKSFLKKIEYGIRKVKKLKKAKNFNEILHPGEPEFRAEQKNLKRGIVIPYEVANDLKALSAKLNIKSPF